MKELKTDAARSLVKIALPENGKNNGLSGAMVRELLEKAGEILIGPGREISKQLILNYLKEMADQAGSD